ncbi:MAG: DEAD/DEAH box helicase [Proteobacteria bacterium]|nr:DEAD/DEAH box helicase [Pseudomonadota bacterium]
MPTNNPIHEYIDALRDSPQLGAQVTHHRILPASQARFGEPRRPLSKPIRELLERSKIEKLYDHQCLAMDLARAGRHVVVATPTASGKTLTYNLPVIEQILAQPDSKALYLFPLKALAQDQLKGFNELVDLLPDFLPADRRPTAAIYDGDTTPYFRKKIRDNPPGVLLTNPEMVHLSLLPHHNTWAGFFAGLTHVVVDEVHTYRGVMGSHMALVFRRLRRICRAWGTDPVFIFCSATVGNPGQLCQRLTNLEVTEVTESGAAKSAQHMVFINPLTSPAQAAIQLLQSALARGLRTIVYTQSRKLTELIAMWASERGGEFADRISAYRAGFLPEERREIEARMSSGELLAVISTSALELGIDIGGLDLCILVGYPGSIMATWQRGGRVGRAKRDSAVVLLAGEDALDQYFMRHPEDFFSRSAENAVLNPYNPVILTRHLVCAAAEMAIRPAEPFLQEQGIGLHAELMVRRGELFEVVGGRKGEVAELVTHRKRPHRDVDLRGAGKSMHIEDLVTGEEIGTIDHHRAFKEAHPGAVYLHRGDTYLIDELDLEAGAVRARRRRVTYYTRVRGSKSTEILEVLGRREVFGTLVYLGRLRVTEEITGFEKRSVRGGTLMGIEPLTLPPLVFETEGLWFVVPDEIRRRAEDEYLHFMGGIHALEHAAIGILPLMVLTDRNDLGGISTPFHPQVNAPAVFIYDGLPGGAGLTRQAFEVADDLFLTTLKTIQDCGCDLGCPSCVHSPKCGSGNRPIDKAAATFLLQQIITGEAMELVGHCPEPEIIEEKIMTRPERYGVLDIETRRSAAEVGGWNRANRMGVSIAVLYDSATDEFIDYEEHQIHELVDKLNEFELIIGFNIIRFDYLVLSGLSDFNFRSLPTLDLLGYIHERQGFRIKLDTLAQATLDAAKSADGLQALEWWKEGRLDLITEYCRQDVAVTRDLYLHGVTEGCVYYTNKAGQKVRMPVDW